MVLLSVSGLSFRAADRTILDHLDTTVVERQIHALLGANGTGKTTLACMIMGCADYVPTADEILFRGRDITSLPMHERARLGITMAWQEPARFDGLRVRDYLGLGRDAGDPAECLRQVGLEPEAYLDRALDETLSGGQRKRIELASIIALGPALALLDEPASGIDLLSIGEIADVIRGLQRKGGAVLVITHREEIARIADRASWLCGGRIAFSGDPDAVADRYRSRRCTACDGKVCLDGRAG